MLRTVPLRRALIGPFTTLSLGAAAIHFAVTDAHFQEWWAFGLFMASVAWFQALWPMAYALRRSTRLALLGALVNIVTAGVWTWSRYRGLPFGPGAGAPMPIGLPDVLATVFELLLFVGLLATALRPAGRDGVQPRIAQPLSVAWTAILALAVAISTSAAITIGMSSMP